MDLHLDLRALPIADDAYDLVYASHVLEHIDDDMTAISEIHRILVPGGIAILPVPIVAEHTVEYGSPNRFEDGHVRAPGSDYFERYRSVFQGGVDIVTSGDVDQEIQPWIFENRSRFPTMLCPQRPAMLGHRHPDFVPICRKARQAPASRGVVSDLRAGKQQTA